MTTDILYIPEKENYLVMFDIGMKKYIGSGEDYSKELENDCTKPTIPVEETRTRKELYCPEFSET